VRPITTTPAIAEAILAAAAEADGWPAFSEHKLRGMHGDVSARWGAAEHEGAVVAVGVAAKHTHGDGSVHWALEVAVDPAARQPDVERGAIETLTGLVPQGVSSTLWTARGAQERAASALGFRTVRTVVRMGRSLPAETPVPIAGVAVRPVDLAEEAGAVARVNNRAFAGHRENASMTEATITELAKASWFEPLGFLLAIEAGAVVGFCWTKVETPGTGEIYIIGVDPRHHGRGLGRLLVTSGLHDLHQRRGCRTGFLWTDGDNREALGLYEALGFVVSLVNRELAQPNS